MLMPHKEFMMIIKVIITGATITLFKGPVYAKSSKQKLMTKTSVNKKIAGTGLGDSFCPQVA